MPYFGTSRGGGGGRIPLAFKKKYLWAHLHNLIEQNNNFSTLKKINILLDPPPPPLTDTCEETNYLANLCGTTRG